MADAQACGPLGVDDDYLAALGGLTYRMAGLEWLAIEVITRLDAAATPESFAGKPGGHIATQLKQHIDRAGLAEPLRTRLTDIADRYAALPPKRNAVAHARPATTRDGGQRLYRWAPDKEAHAFWIDETFLADLCAEVEAVTRDMERVRHELPPGLFQRGAQPSP